MKTNQAILLAVAAAAGAYYIATKYRKEPAYPDGPLPLPPLPEPDPEGAGYDGVPTSWDEIDFDVDVFPPGTSLDALDPPLDESRWSVAENCEAIALGHGVWERLRDAAQMHLDMGMSVEDTIAAVQKDVFSLTGPGGFGPKTRIMACIESGSQAGRLLVSEIRDRVRFMSGPWITAGPKAPFQASQYQPVGNPRMARQVSRAEHPWWWQDLPHPSSRKDCTSHGQCGPLESCDDGKCVPVDLVARPSRRQPRVAQAVMYALGMR